MMTNLTITESSLHLRDADGRHIVSQTLVPSEGGVVLVTVGNWPSELFLTAETLRAVEAMHGRGRRATQYPTDLTPCVPRHDADLPVVASPKD